MHLYTNNPGVHTLTVQRLVTGKISVDQYSCRHLLRAKEEILNSQKALLSRVSIVIEIIRKKCPTLETIF